MLVMVFITALILYYFPISVFKGFKTSRTTTDGQIWDRTYGGMGEDEAWGCISLSDGGFLVVGYTSSWGAGYEDMWVMKLDTNGEKEWDQIYGTPDMEMASDVVQCDDGSYLILGRIFVGYAVNPDYYWEDENRNEVAFLMKINSEGRQLWNRTIGGPKVDRLIDIFPTSDGGYLLNGWTSSNKKDSYDFDAWLVKIDNMGVIEWNQTYGRSEWYEGLTGITLTPENNYMLCGFSMDEKEDVLLIKTDLKGEMEWNKLISLGSETNAEVYDLLSTSDGGCVISGCTYKEDYDKSVMLLMKTDSEGDLTWHQTYGTTEQYSSGYYIAQTIDNGFLLIGDKFTSDRTESDMWVVKTDTNGELTWSQSFGGSETEYLGSYCFTKDNNLVLVGSSGTDLWIVKTDIQIQMTPTTTTSTTSIIDGITPGIDFLALGAVLMFSRLIRKRRRR